MVDGFELVVYERHANQVGERFSCFVHVDLELLEATAHLDDWRGNKASLPNVLTFVGFSMGGWKRRGYFERDSSAIVASM